MSLPKEGSAGMLTWTDPESRVPYTVILAPDFGTTSDALEAWEHYREHLGTVHEVYIAQHGIQGLPMAEDFLATFLALGSTGRALALSGTNCGYPGEGPHGTARILRELGISEAVVSLVFHERAFHFVRLEDRWMVEVDPDSLAEEEP